MGKMIGIDLGTTNSVVAYWVGSQPQVLYNRENKVQTRSLVGLRKRKGKKGDVAAGELLVGDAALDNWELAPKDTVVSVKRLMGRGFGDADVQRVMELYDYAVRKPADGTKDSVRVVIGEKEYSPVEVSAMVLRKLKEDTEFRLGDEVSHAVITVPAYFSQIQRDATRKAGLAAGLKVIKILDEPTAAAVAFGMEANPSGEPKYILVYDLGGGTFDISVLMWAGNVFAPLNLEGDMWLGGDNFDQLLIDRAVAHVKEEFGIDPVGNKRFMVALRKVAQAAKERLGAAQATDLIVPGLLQDREGDLLDLELEVTRRDYETWASPLVARTMALVEKALHNAGVTAEQVDYVLMAGNATAMPLVQQTVEARFGAAKMLRSVHPKHSVALGAAIVANRIGAQVVCQAPSPADPKLECGHVNPSDALSCGNCKAPLALREETSDAGAVGFVIGGIAPFAYGVQTAGDRFHRFIAKGDPYPTEEPVAQTFYTRTANQRMISIPVYGGDHAEKASLNEKQGEAFAMLPPSLPKGSAIRIKIWLDHDGVFGLAAHHEHGLDLNPWTLKGEADARAVEVIEQVEEALAKKARELPPNEVRALEGARNEAFEELRRGRFNEAVRKAEKAQELVEQAGRKEETEALRTKAEGLINYTRFVLQNYAWAFDAEKVYQLNELVEKTEAALKAANPDALAAAVKSLDTATDELPQEARMLLAMRSAIVSRVRPVDPARAASLLSELDQVETACKARTSEGLRQAAQFAEKLSRAIAEADQSRPGGAVCGVCSAELNGQRRCPKCGEDSWTLTHEGAAATSGSIGR